MTRQLVPPFLLIQDTGYTMEFDDLLALRAAVSEARIVIAKKHVTRRIFYENSDSHCYSEWGKIFHSEWIVRDSFGQIVDYDDLLRAYKAARFPRILPERKRLIRHAAKLGLPIPFTGHRSYGASFRSPQTTRTNRQRAAMLVDDRHETIHPRGKIKIAPTSWDDVYRKSLRDRNWKRFRRTQARDT